MIRLDIGDDHPVGIELHERPVTLVGLDHQEWTLPDRSPGAQIAKVATHDERWVEAGAAERGGQHRRGGGLAMRSGHGNRLPRSGDRSQDLSPAQNRDSLSTSLDELGVVGRYRCGVGDDLSFSDVFGTMTDRNRGATIDQAVQGRRPRQIRAGHQVARSDQDLGDGAHAGPTDPEDVDSLGCGQIHGCTRPTASCSRATRHCRLLSPTSVGPRDRPPRSRSPQPGGRRPAWRPRLRPPTWRLCAPVRPPTGPARPRGGRR